ncbi:6501_t:CDS:2 [Funneliformis mosseae]|uniref:6501_t:CDS:1 n=1 Tax=Funneliformis mosseae TaxID=27381 RepID=A0A9N8ZRE2_FUNMO|nr:6501_t:CDS:2 [Funneliformis mosseae]
MTNLAKNKIKTISLMEHNQYASNPTLDHPIYCIITTMGMIDSAHITSKENHSSRKIKSDLLLPVVILTLKTDSLYNKVFVDIRSFFPPPFLCNGSPYLCPRPYDEYLYNLPIYEASRRVTNEMSNLLRIKHIVNDHPDKLQELWEQKWISNDVNISDRVEEHC